MTVLAVGDSVSFGYELGDIPGPPVGWGNNFYAADTMTCKPLCPSQLAYPKLLADRWGTDCKNLSLVGGSNDRTYRVVADHVLQQQYDLVICSWTSIDRFDFVYRNQDIALNVATSPWQSVQFPWLKSFVADHYDPVHMTSRFYAQLISLQALLKQLDQPYIFVNNCDFQVNIDTAQSQYQHYIKHIDTSRYFQPESDLTTMCRQQGFAIGPEGHFLEAGHEYVSQQLHNTVKELYL
jgi:hypothetical protein